MKSDSFVHKIPGISDLLHRLPIPPFVHRAIFIVDTLIHDMIRCDIPKQASAMAYTTLLSIIPSLAAFFSILTIFVPIMGQDSQIMAQAQSFIINNLAQGTGSQVSDVLNGFIEKLDVTQIGISSFAGLLVTLIMLLKQIEKSLNRIWLVRKERNMFTRLIYFWTFLTLGAFLGSMAIGMASGFDLSSIMDFGSSAGAAGAAGEVATKGSSKFLGFFTALTFFFFLYKVGPNCKVSIVEALVGAVVAAFLFQQAGALFGYYVANFSKHAAIYGALAALPLFLTWIYVCWVIILLGSVIGWRTQQGFPIMVESKSEESESVSSPEMKMRDLRLQTIAPFMALMAIYREFSSGNAKGLSGSELTKRTNLPSLWISDALETLESMKYVVAAVDGNESENSGDYMTSQFFPTTPAGKVTVQKIFADLLEPTNSSLEKWNRKIPEENVEILNLFRTANVKENPDMKISDIFPSSFSDPVIEEP